ncbi:MAG: LuxR C-terminal-related transcriptional regulator [Phycisphaerales bacterium JB063]
MSRDLLQHWASSRPSGWRQTGLADTGPTVHERDLHDETAHPAKPADRLFFKLLQSRHAILLHSHVSGIVLDACVFLAQATADQVALTRRALQAKLPTMTGRLTLLLQPPVITQSRSSHKPLTDSEKEILPLLMQRLSERAIAEVLKKSRNTVHAHVKSIYIKLGVHSREELRKRQQTSEKT